MDVRIPELERRLANAEARVRLTGVGGISMLVLMATLTTAKPAAVQPKHNSVIAPFTVVDARGRPILRVDAGGHDAAHPQRPLPRLELIGRLGKPLAGLYATPSGGMLTVNDMEGDSGASLQALGFGGILHILDQSEDSVVTLRAVDQGGLIEFHSRPRGALAGTLAADNRGGRLVLYDRAGNEIFTAPQ